jgi:hypothetical protein
MLEPAAPWLPEAGGTMLDPAAPWFMPLELPVLPELGWPGVSGALLAPFCSLPLPAGAGILPFVPVAPEGLVPAGGVPVPVRGPLYSGTSESSSSMGTAPGGALQPPSAMSELRAIARCSQADVRSVETRELRWTARVGAPAQGKRRMGVHLSARTAGGAAGSEKVNSLSHVADVAQPFARRR